MRFPLFLLGAWLPLGVATAALVDPYNVVWDSPSSDHHGSMPLGNGDVALNAWFTPAGELHCYLAKSDGLVNQLAAQRGLAAGATPPRVLETVAAIRRESAIPIVLYVYYDVLHRRGVGEFITDAARAGVDGLLVLDLPPRRRTITSSGGARPACAPSGWWPPPHHRNASPASPPAPAASCTTCRGRA